MKISREKIEAELARQQISASTLGDRIGMQRQQVYSILARGSCTPASAGRLAKGLGVDVEKIMGVEAYTA